jgi:hypothetical protein
MYIMVNYTYGLAIVKTNSIHHVHVEHKIYDKPNPLFNLWITSVNEKERNCNEINQAGIVTVQRAE